MNVNLKKVLVIAATAIFICAGLVITGCGGGGGSGSTLSPEELEVATVLDAFAAAVSAKEVVQAMNHVFGGLKYYGGFNTEVRLGYQDFQTRLEKFFEKASNIDCRFTSQGISVSDNTATVRALLIVDYSVGGMPQTMPPENVELKFEKDKRWGIVEFARYDKTTGTAVTAFPPQ